MTRPTLQGALQRVREDPDARFAALLAGVMAFSFGFAFGFAMGEAEGRLDADEAERDDT